MDKDSSILITGVSDSFGNAFVEMLLTVYSDIRRAVGFSRDELKQSEMARFPNPSTHQLDITLARRISDWEPEVSLTEGLLSTVDYFKRETGND